MPIEVLASLTGATRPAAADPLTVRLLALALTAAISVIAALVTAVLVKIEGAHPATAVLRGGAAFGCTLALGIAILAGFGVL